MKFVLIMMTLLGLELPVFASWSKQSNDTLKTKIGVIIPRYNFELQAPANVSSSKLKLEPNAPTKTIYGLTYRNLGLTFSQANPPDADSQAKYGSSSSTDFQLRFFGKRTYEFFYQSYSGYYITNSDEMNPAYIGSASRILRPDISTSHYGMTMYWSLDEKDFSQAVAFDQAGRQNNSSWGTAWLINASQSNITSDTALVPATATSQFGTLGYLKHLHRNNISVGYAIGGIATWANFYASSLLAFGLGANSVDADFTNAPSATETGTGSYLSIRASLGYNGERNVLAFQLISDGVGADIKGGKSTGNTLELGLTYAFRFQGVDLPFLNGVSSWFD